MSLDLLTALSALRLASLLLPFPGVLFCAAVAQLHSTERHLVDPIDQLANVFLSASNRNSYSASGVATA
jgi:hypothetical protein